MRMTARVTTLSLAVAAWLATAAPAWANAVDPELYPEAAAEYERMMTTTFGIIFGCFGLAVIGFVAFVVLLIVWLLRRDKRKQAEALAAAGAEPAAAAQPQAPAAGAAETPPTDGL